MPKRKRQPAAVARPAPRRPSPRLDAERRNQMVVAAVSIGVVVIALGIALFGYYQTQIAPKGEPVMKIGERSFSLGFFERRARYEVRNNNTTLLADASRAPESLLAMVMREELLRQGAAEQGITLTAADLDAEVRKKLGVSPDADQSAFAEVYRRDVQDSGLATSDYRDIIAADALERRLQQTFQEEVPPAIEQVLYRIIQVATVEEAQAVLDRLGAGEDFAALVTELSTDSASKERGGEKPWAPRGILEQPLEDALFALEPGQRSGIVETQLGPVIAEVIEKQADRETTPEQRIEVGNAALEDWLVSLRERTPILTFLEDDQINAIVTAVVEEAGQRA